MKLTKRQLYDYKDIDWPELMLIRIGHHLWASLWFIHGWFLIFAGVLIFAACILTWLTAFADNIAFWQVLARFIAGCMILLIGFFIFHRGIDLLVKGAQ